MKSFQKSLVLLRGDSVFDPEQFEINPTHTVQTLVLCWWLVTLRLAISIKKKKKKKAQKP